MSDKPKNFINTVIVAVCVTAIVAGGGGFVGGTAFGKSRDQGVKGGLPAMFQQDGQRVMGGNLAGDPRATATRTGGGRNGGGLVGGEIIAMDDQSITLKLNDGGSKIVFLSDKTEVGRFVSGIASDLEVGKTVMVTGTANADGSLMAQSIQERSGMMRPNGGQAAGEQGAGVPIPPPPQ